MGPTRPADVDATVDAAVSATATAQVQATASLTVAPTVGVSATVTPDYGALSEEVLVELIDESMAEVATGSEESAEAAAGSVEDGVVTQEEADEINYLLTETEAVISECEELILIYEEIYGELASETLDLLLAMEDDLDSLTSAVLAIAGVYDELEFTAADAVELTDEVIAEVEASALLAETAAAQIVARRDEWMIWVADADGENLELLLSLQPSDVLGDRAATVLAVHQYVEAVSGVLADGGASLEELEQVAALAANACAGIDANGGPQLKSLGSSIETITAQLIHGQLDAALGGVESLKSVVGNLPAVR